LGTDGRKLDVREGHQHAAMAHLHRVAVLDLDPEPERTHAVFDAVVDRAVPANAVVVELIR
jgi:hypothetical protein